MSEQYEGVIRPPVHSELHAQLLPQHGGIPEDEYDDNIQNDVPKGPVVQAPAAHTPKQFIAAAFEQAARNGDPGAQWSYAHCLQAGDEYVQADNVMATVWFQNAIVGLHRQSATGDAKALYRLASCYHWGFGCTAAPSMSTEYADRSLPGLRSLASAGDTEAANFLGTLLYNGLGTAPADVDEGLRWRQIAADAGHAPALLFVGTVVWQRGDADKAADHLLKASSGGMLSGRAIIEANPKLQQAAVKIEGKAACDERREQLQGWAAMNAAAAAATAAPAAPTTVQADWMQDSVSRSCLECNTAFSLLRRRHHCRFCGLLVCSGCCSIQLYGAQGNIRGCVKCNTILQSYTHAVSTPRTAPTATGGGGGGGSGSGAAGFCVGCGASKVGGTRFCTSCGHTYESYDPQAAASKALSPRANAQTTPYTHAQPNLQTYPEPLSPHHQQQQHQHQHQHHPASSPPAPTLPPPAPSSQAARPSRPSSAHHVTTPASPSASNSDSQQAGIFSVFAAAKRMIQSVSLTSRTEGKFDARMTLKRKSVTLAKVIGKGNFGKVYSGTATDPLLDNAIVQVAVKSPSVEALEDFDAELDVMANLTELGGHPHIVRVIGCVYGAEPLLVLEFCAGGSLKSNLTKARSGKAATPTVPVLTKYGHHVALAMKFLEDHKLMHRDLAARNVLLAEQNVCKLCDFGLSRNGGASEYYRRNDSSAPIPVRWMAPETLDENVSTIESDRWSFGVLLWEIYSLAARPYVGVQNYEIASHVREGQRLAKPALCPDAVYALMQQCWSIAPGQRPAFATLAVEIHRLHQFL